jgi:hypothetical protein
MKNGLVEGQTDHVARLRRCTGMVWYQSACHLLLKNMKFYKIKITCSFQIEEWSRLLAWNNRSDNSLPNDVKKTGQKLLKELSWRQLNWAPVGDSSDMRFDQNHMQYDHRAVGKSEMSIWWCWKQKKWLDVQTGEQVTGNLEDLMYLSIAYKVLGRMDAT